MVFTGVCDCTPSLYHKTLHEHARSLTQSHAVHEEFTPGCIVDTTWLVVL